MLARCSFEDDVVVGVLVAVGAFSSFTLRNVRDGRRAAWRARRPRFPARIKECWCPFVMPPEKRKRPAVSTAEGKDASMAEGEEASGTLTHFFGIVRNSTGVVVRQAVHICLLHGSCETKAIAQLRKRRIRDAGGQATFHHDRPGITHFLCREDTVEGAIRERLQTEGGITVPSSAVFVKSSWLDACLRNKRVEPQQLCVSRPAWADVSVARGSPWVHQLIPRSGSRSLQRYALDARADTGPKEHQATLKVTPSSTLPLVGTIEDEPASLLPRRFIRCCSPEVAEQSAAAPAMTEKQTLLVMQFNVLADGLAQNQYGPLYLGRMFWLLFRGRANRFVCLLVKDSFKMHNDRCRNRRKQFGSVLPHPSCCASALNRFKGRTAGRFLHFRSRFQLALDEIQRVLPDVLCVEVCRNEAVGETSRRRKHLLVHSLGPAGSLTTCPAGFPPYASRN